MGIHQIDESPHFNIHPSATPEAEELIRDIELGINESPELYSAAFDACIAALDQDISTTIRTQARYLKSKPVDADKFPLVFDQWLSFMKSRLDGEFTFDELTENAISTENTLIKQLLLDRNKPDSDKELIRNRIRYERLSFYIGRVAMLKAINASTDTSSDEEVA